MTKPIQIIFSTLLLTVVSCSNDRKVKEKSTQSSSIDTLTNKSENTGNEIYLDKAKEIEITLVSDDLNIISSLTVNEKTDYFETGKQLNKYLQIELIDKSLFDNKKKSSVDFLLADTTKHKKTNGIITLNCQNKVVKYIDKDKPEVGELRQEFQYVGQFQFLNQYLIGGSYWESIDYRLIDKTSGKETQIFEEYPNVSPDKKHIISIYANPYETTAELELFTIENNNIKHKISVSFKYWMPTGDSGKMFWNADGFLYLTVNHKDSFWTEDGQFNSKYQYIRIKIL